MELGKVNTYDLTWFKVEVWVLVYIAKMWFTSFYIAKMLLICG